MPGRVELMEGAAGSAARGGACGPGSGAYPGNTAPRDAGPGGVAGIDREGYGGQGGAKEEAQPRAGRPVSGPPSQLSYRISVDSPKYLDVSYVIRILQVKMQGMFERDGR
jgi:hypothetical protein